jgi:hypothetical protein
MWSSSIITEIRFRPIGDYYADLNRVITVHRIFAGRARISIGNGFSVEDTW